MKEDEQAHLLQYVQPLNSLPRIESAFKPVSSTSNHGRNLWLGSYVRLTQDNSPPKESHIAELERFVDNFSTQELPLERSSSCSSEFNPRKRRATLPSPKSRRTSKKTLFSEFQTEALEKNFQFKNYLSPASRTWLANLLGLSKQQVVTWFQNRRAKERRRAGVKLPRHGRKCTVVGNFSTTGLAEHKSSESSGARIFPAF